MGRLTGRTAIITGAGSGIGRASSILFAQEGANLVIADKAETVHETAQLVKDAGGKVVSLTGDAGEEAFVESLVATAVKEFGA
ncbi:SDR family NAD(P)-dependent oxidoreductase, partial [Phenylobacterium aquaticum]